MFKMLKRFSHKELLMIALCAVLVFIQVWLELKIPEYMSEITILVETSGSKLSEVLKNGGLMLICAFSSLLTAISVGYIGSLLSSSFSYELRKSIFNKVGKLGLAEINKFSTSSLITRTTNDVGQIEMFIAMGLSAMLRAPIMATCAIVKIVNKQAEWTILVASLVLVLVLFVISIMLVVIPRFKLIQKLIDRVNGVTRENLTGIRVIRAFNAEKFQLDRFDVENKKLTDTQLFTNRVMTLFDPIIYLVMRSLTLGIYIVGVIVISKAALLDKLTIFSDMVVFSNYGMQILMSFLLMSMIFMMWPRVSVSANRINEVLDEEISIKEGTFNKETKEKGTVEFKNVSFKYPDADEYILEDISFKANKGETVAFIGSTGSGKSTLINLVPRFYDATKGEVLVDGINVKDYKFSNLYNKLGYVSQKAFMFNGTVEENVTYGESGKTKPTLKDVKRAIEVAQGKDFVEEMTDGYKSHIARGGTNVSGGQKQRLSIARAIVRNPEIYIFDDSFSALDYKTDATLRKELKKYTKDATSLIVAQRIGTIINADKIIVLDRGKCVGIGTHKELIKNCEVYKEIAYSQLSKEEIENA